MALDRTLSRRASGGGRGGLESAAHVLLRLDRRRRVEDHRRRRLLGERLGRLLPARLGRRDRGGAVRPERDLRGHGRELHPRQRVATATASTARPTPARRGRTSAWPTRATSRKVRVHPTRPDLVYVAALGHAHGPNQERGVFRSRDGGKTWEHVLFRSEDAGASDLSMDPHNPRILYASFWEARRNAVEPDQRRPGQRPVQVDRRRRHLDRDLAQQGPAQRHAGQDRRVGLGRAARSRVRHRRGRRRRRVPLGRRRRDVGAAVRGSQPAPARLVLPPHLRRPARSRDGLGAEHRDLAVERRRQDVQHEFAMPHGDNHDLWIDPDDPQRMIKGNDGGATITFNGGATWSTIYNQPTAEFYHVTTDTRTPVSRVRRAAGQHDDVGAQPVAAGGDHQCRELGRSAAARAATSPSDRTIRTSSSPAATSGFLTRYDHRTGQAREHRSVARGRSRRRREGREVPLPVDLSDRCCRRTIRTCCT